MLKLGKNLSWDFEVIYIFRKNAVLNICRYLKGFYTYKKINNIFLKFHYYLLRMPEIIEIGWIFYSEKPLIKNITNTHTNRFGPVSVLNYLVRYCFSRFGGVTKHYTHKGILWILTWKRNLSNRPGSDHGTMLLIF